MKFSLKLFCIVLISAGLALPACKKKEEATAEADAAVEEGADEAADDEAQEDGAAEEEADAAAQEEGDAAAQEGDAGEEADAAEGDEEEQAAKPEPKAPPITGAVTGNVGGSGITDGELKLVIRKDYGVGGSFTGKREGSSFLIPLEKGQVNPNNDRIDVRGSRGKNSARINGKVTEGGVSGTISGTINEEPFKSNFTIGK